MSEAACSDCVAAKLAAMFSSVSLSLLMPLPPPQTIYSDPLHTALPVADGSVEPLQSAVNSLAQLIVQLGQTLQALWDLPW